MSAQDRTYSEAELESAIQMSVGLGCVAGAAHAIVAGLEAMEKADLSSLPPDKRAEAEDTIKGVKMILASIARLIP